MQWLEQLVAELVLPPLCRLLLYATGGLAYGNVDYSANTNFDNGFYLSSQVQRNKRRLDRWRRTEYAIVIIGA